jgi:hypothetical protein
MSRKFDLFPIRPLTAARFGSWLACYEPGAVLEYHRGYLIFDRSPVSKLSENERRLVAKLADAALQAAAEGRVHLVQRRNGDFDFSYLAIKRSQPSAAAPAAALIHPHALPAAA